jgi:hypothetical protein
VKNNLLQWTCPVFILASATIEARVWNDGTGASSSFVPMHQQSPVSAPSINIYRPAPVWVSSPTQHFSSPLPPPSPNHRNLHRRSRRSKARPTHHWCQLRPPRWVCRPRKLPPHEFPTSTSLLLAYTPSSLGISPSWYGQRRTRGVNITTLPLEWHPKWQRCRRLPSTILSASVTHK